MLDVRQVLCFAKYSHFVDCLNTAFISDLQDILTVFQDSLHECTNNGVLLLDLTNFVVSTSRFWLQPGAAVASYSLEFLVHKIAIFTHRCWGFCFLSIVAIC